MELPVSSDCGACPQLFCKDGAFGACSSSHDHAATQQPAKKQTRQWAAWTRQEEESFFTALRQVGKNFEKITYRVQSKNKDQVRHYYYRLVRRMNKLLGPELCLDAKNDKDTNAAMLRWWSLLEKHSCKASKLHLKPRRFKIFLDTLEHQLLKDRRKNIRKRHAQGDVCSMTSTAAVIGHGKAVVNDTQAVKVVLLDSQNIQRFGSGKGSSLKRNANMGTNRSNCKGDSIPLKAVRQRRKPAAYKRWEKAAIAGVSLVADAAEHLERTALEEVPEHDKGAFQEVIGGDKDLEPVQKVVTSSATPLRNLFSENCAQTSSKLKLQLFPLDEITRRALELDDHNPYLELTLSTRKKISSVLEHLTRKWGKSSIACGELLLLPYWIEKENLSNCQRWTQDSVLSAADVYKQIGSPSLFRLRYCWLSSDVHEPMTVQAPVAFPSILKEQLTKMTGTDLQLADLVPGPTLPEHVPGDPFGVHRNQVVSSGNVSESATTSANMHDDIIGINADPNMNIGFPCDNVPAISSQRKTRNVAIRKEAEEKDEMRFQTRNILTPGEWADSLTNISFGDLLYEASDDVDDDCVGPSNAGYQSQVPFSCDSFDAAIAALIYKNQDKAGFHPTLESHAPSIWDAEETCDAFSFRKSSVSPEKISGASTNDPSEACREFAKQSLVASDFVIEESSEMKAPPVDKAHGDPMDEFQPDPNTIEDSTKDSTGLSDLYWSESLAPLDLDRPSCKYHNEDLILSDSMSGLNRLIASSLDAFQNLSFFGLDKKDSASVVETREGISFSDYKNGSQVEISKV